jgi:hypothetical protein
MKQNEVRAGVLSAGIASLAVLGSASGALANPPIEVTVSGTLYRTAGLLYPWGFTTLNGNRVPIPDGTRFVARFKFYPDFGTLAAANWLQGRAGPAVKADIEVAGRAYFPQPNANNNAAYFKRTADVISLGVSEPQDNQDGMTLVLVPGRSAPPFTLALSGPIDEAVTTNPPPQSPGATPINVIFNYTRGGPDIIADQLNPTRLTVGPARTDTFALICRGPLSRSTSPTSTAVSVPFKWSSHAGAAATQDGPEQGTCAWADRGPKGTEIRPGFSNVIVDFPVRQSLPGEDEYLEIGVYRNGANNLVWTQTVGLVDPPFMPDPRLP